MTFTAASAAAASVVAVVPSGVARPGLPVEVVVALETPTTAPPVASASSGSIRYLRSDRLGVYVFELVPPAEVADVEVSISAGGERDLLLVPVRVPDRVDLEVPERVDGLAGGGAIRWLVTGPNLPDPEALQIETSEGRVLGVTPTEAGLEITLEPDELPFARVVLVGVRDLRSEASPSWTELRLRARPRLPLVAEPGATLDLSVGERTYGPFTAAADGSFDARVDQYPGEFVAHARVVDDLGNETYTDVPLAVSSAPALVAFAERELVPRQVPPGFYVRGLQADGSPMTETPRCETPGADLVATELKQGGWRVQLPRPSELGDMRVACTLADGVSLTRRLRVAEGAAPNMKLRVWPLDLRADFPISDVRVMIEDARGDRMPIDGVAVRAQMGTVQASPPGTGAWVGEYDGSDAVTTGSDRLIATWSARAGTGAPMWLELGWGLFRSSGRVRVHARVRDLVGRPVEGVEVALAAGREPITAVSGPDGWASAEIDTPTGTGPVVLTAHTEWREVRTAVPRIDLGHGGPGTADLREEVEIKVSPGRVTGISVSVDPPYLRAGPAALAFIYVSLEDRSGSPVTDEDLDVDVSEGTVGPVRQQPDGSFVAEYTPEASERRREVVITASTGSIRSNAVLVLEPRVVALSVGPWGGLQANFGQVLSPTFGADIDVRTRFIAESVMFRLGAAGYGVRAAATDAGSEAQLQAVVAPITAGILLRADRRGTGLWGGIGGTIAIQRLRVVLDEQTVADGWRMGVGPTVMGGVSRRLSPGEVVLTATGSWIGGGRGELAVTGNLGGLAVGLGYRLLY